MRRTTLCLAAVFARGCGETADRPLASLEVDGFEYEVEYTHFGHWDAVFSGPLMLHADVPLGDENLQLLRVGVDLTTVRNDDPEVYDVQLVDVCGPASSSKCAAAAIPSRPRRSTNCRVAPAHSSAMAMSPARSRAPSISTPSMMTAPL